jgi:hypothetical protein
MAKAGVWCNMIYTIIFYVILMNYIYQSITGNIDMQQKCFQGLVILAFLNLFNSYTVSRR